MEASNPVYNEKIFYLNQGTIYHGALQNISEATSLHECTSVCLKEEDCEAVLFNEMEMNRSKCYIIKYGVDAIDISNMDGYSYLTKGECMGVPIPDKWKPGCPHLYINMENIHGGLVLGTSNPQFNPGGKVGSMFHRNTNSTLSSYAGFAWYTGIEHCFSQPKYCDEGVSYAMWVNLLGDNENVVNGFFTSTFLYLSNSETGVNVAWIPSHSLYFAVKTNDTADTIFLQATHFMSDYGYNNWVHCVFVYKYGGPTPGTSDIKIYLNGIEENTNRSSNSISLLEKTDKFLIIGDSGQHRGHLNMDEFLVWQKMLSSEDIKKLYDAYKQLPKLTVH